MLDELVGYLNHLRAGDVLTFIITCVFAIQWIRGSIKKLFAEHRTEVEAEIQKTENLNKLTQSVSDAHSQIETLQQNFEQKVSYIENLLNERIELTDNNKDKVENVINQINDLLTSEMQKLDLLENRIDKIETQIDLLFRSDKEYFRAYIMDGYNRYVKCEKSIDLISLQNLEVIYNKYLEEDGVTDEFLSKLMKELRNLPTTKEKRRD